MVTGDAFSIMIAIVIVIVLIMIILSIMHSGKYLVYFQRNIRDEDIQEQERIKKTPNNSTCNSKKTGM